MSLYSFTECLDAQGILIFLLLFLLITDIVKNKKPKNFPPGPWGLPFVGNIFNIDFKQLHISTAKLAEIYGNVYSLRLGRNKAVFVTGYQMVKEALINQAETFAARPPSPTMERLYSNYGLFFSNGYLWKKQRRFVLSTLRNFGLGRKTLESVISEESRFLQQAIEDEQGKPFNPHFLLNNAVSNIICSMVFGRRFDYSDNRFQRLLHLLSETMHLEGTIWTLLYEAFPVILKYLPGPHNRVFKNYEELQAFVGEEVERHKEDWDPSAPRDYIDSYLAEIQKTNGPRVPLSVNQSHTAVPRVILRHDGRRRSQLPPNKEDTEAGFHEKNLVLCTLDLFIAGTETTSTSLRWALLYMIKHPEIQKKVQAEIESVLGQGRQPSMTNKPNMSYTDAVIHEIQRISNIVPLNAPRMTTKDTTLGGYFLPKGTPVMTNLTSVLFDKTEWQTPDSFNPGHFLDSEGKFVRREAFLPFSAGKRVCLGEQLARMELFLFFTSFLQNFTFKAPEGEEPSVEFQLGGILTPRPFKICAIPR
ncbi:cytochrome P450 2J2-like isoform X1 [Lepisosteus oculatus]|uniref:cytochrome P450 2J2-like isoform X1 n=1 Tax=Lepisosteus oculatus TaxID=7918 RepID=UPI0037226D9C